MRNVTPRLNEGETPTPRGDVQRTHASRHRGPRVGPWAAIALVAVSLAIPAGAAGYYDTGAGPGHGPSSGAHSAPSVQATELPTGKQIAQHRGVPPGAFLSTDRPARSPLGRPPGLRSGADGSMVLILIVSAALVAAVGVGAVAAANHRARPRRTPQLGV